VSARAVFRLFVPPFVLKRAADEPRQGFRRAYVRLTPLLLLFETTWDKAQPSPVLSGKLPHLDISFRERLSSYPVSKTATPILCCAGPISVLQACLAVRSST